MAYSMFHKRARVRQREKEETQMKIGIDNWHGGLSWLRSGVAAAALAGLASCAAGVDDQDLGIPPDDTNEVAPGEGRRPGDRPVRTPDEQESPDGVHKALNYKPGKILVRFKRDAGISAQAALHDQLGTRTVHTYRFVPDLQVVALPEKMSVERALAYYKRNPNVAYAEPNYIYTLDATTPNDPLFGELYGLHNTGQTGGTPDADIDAPEAWDLSQGSDDVVIALLDSGIDYTHPDLTANTFVNLTEFEGTPGVDDDGNGFVDDVHGINTIEDIGDPFPNDGDAHGTHVSGTIAAAGNDGFGVVGVNWRAKIVGCKAFSFSASLEDIIQCLDYFLDLKTRAVNPANIIASNNSWGGGGFSQALLDAIEAQNAAGVLFIAAAGNDSSDNDQFPHFPSSYESTNIIAVAATNHFDELAFFSSFGANSVDVGAPGEDILSSVPGGDFAIFSGTSMATPHTAGLAALIKADDPSRTAAQIKNLILTGGDVTVGTDGTTLTGRRINAFGSLTCTDSVLNNRFAPSGDNLIVGIGTPVNLGVLSINCDQPNPASLVVRVVETGQTIPLLDPAGSGEFRGQFVAFELGSFTLEFRSGATVIDTVSVSAIGNYDPPRLVDGDCREITGESISLGDDDAIEIVSDFPILFAGASPGFTNLFIGSNGVLSFSDPIFSFINEPLPSAASETIVAPFWDDLNPGAGGEVLLETIGAPGSREFVVEYRQVPHFFNAGAITVQVVFTENSPNIVFNYCDVTFEDDPFFSGGASATIGVQVAFDVAREFSFDTASVSDGDAVVFSMGAPIAVAGADQVVLPGASVTLDGSASDDFDGVIVRHTWTQVAGEPVDLIGANSPVATFTAPLGSGTLTFQLEVEDNEGQVSTDTVDVIVNVPPIAEAGADFRVATLLVGTLDCSASVDPDGTIVGFQWEQLGGDPVVITSDGSAVATFVAPAAAQFLVFQCTVTDDLGFTDSDVVVADVFFNAFPVAEAGNDQIARTGSVVTLDGTRSTDSDGTVVTYSWQTTLCITLAGPCELTFDDASSPTPSFTAPSARGFAQIMLSATDNIGATSQDSLVVYFANQPPNVVATVDPECVSPGDLVTLSAACVDPDGSVASLQWRQIAGAPVTLNGADTASATFTAPATGPLAFEVTCTDNDGLTDFAAVTVDISAAPVAVAVCAPVGVFEGQTVSCNALGSQNAVDFTWSSPTDPSLIIPPGVTTSFIAPLVNAFRIVDIQLTASNECGSTATDIVQIVVVSLD
jgi:serine protease